MRLFPLKTFISRFKESIVINRYYGLHEKIFNVPTCAKMEKVEGEIENFYYMFMGYVDEDLLLELCNALARSMYRRTRILASATFRTA